jgi:hypothetical protein
LRGVRSFKAHPSKVSFLYGTFSSSQPKTFAGPHCCM